MHCIEFPVTTPGETLARAVDFFRGRRLRAIGIASFGPIDRECGTIGSTPKPGWSGVPIVNAVKQALALPVAFDTDVNGAALAEHRWGALQNCSTGLYITIGTGIGGGAILNGLPLHGASHPEMGHLRIPRRADDPFPGSCPFHLDCWEGLASGPAIEARWGAKAETLHLDHPAWEIESEYIALALVNLTCILSPERIVLGGGVMQQSTLLPRIAARLESLINGYVRMPVLSRPRLGRLSGVLGAIALAQDCNAANSLLASEENVS